MSNTSGVRKVECVMRNVASSRPITHYALRLTQKNRISTKQDLSGEQAAFLLKAAGIASQRPISSYDSVAWNAGNECLPAAPRTILTGAAQAGVAAQGIAHGTRGLWTPNLPGNPLIGTGLPSWDAPDSPIYQSLKVRQSVPDSLRYAMRRCLSHARENGGRCLSCCAIRCATTLGS
jgi:hypothetical protein